MKQDEKKFLIDLYLANQDEDYLEVFPREIIQSDTFHIPYKRAWYILEKWFGKDWYEYGCVLDCGWLTDEGKAEAKRLIEEEK